MSDGAYTIDNYELIDCIASGSFSQVWEVSETGIANHLAMKLLLPEAFEESEQRQALKHEAKVAKSLDHPSLVKFRKLVVNKKNAYIIMDYFRAPNLKSQLISDLPSVQMQAKKLIESLCLSLAYMHDKGWIHRDVKPDNILSNKGSELRLVDFSLSCRIASGLSKLVGGKAKVIQGTRTYIAPETLRKAKPTPQTDMYSLGVTIFEILTGEPPFVAVNPSELLRKHLKESAPAAREVNPNVTPEMSEFVARLLFKNPAKRHKDMNEVHADFRTVQVFNQDPVQLAKRMQAQRAQNQELAESLADQTTSRHDVKLMAAGERSATADGPQQTKPKTPAPAPAQPQTPYPGAMPQQPLPGQPTPQPYQQPMAYPPQQPPGQPQPMGQPPAGWQQQPMPEPQYYQPPPGTAAAPPYQPQPQPPVAGQPQPPEAQPLPPQETPPPPQAPPPKPGDEDLPVMEDLPDVF